MTTAEQAIVGYHAADARVRDHVAAVTRSMWLSAGSWRDVDVDRLVDRIVPVVEGGKRNVAELTASYARTMAQTIDRIDIGTPLLSSMDLALVRGIPPREVYRRPAVQMYRALAGGALMSDAIDQGVQRLGSLVATDLQLAKTHQERRSWARGGYEYTVRTLTGRENCALCVIASTQRYTVSDLRPIHPGCDCGSRQLSARYDPGITVDSGLLESVQAEIASHVGTFDSNAFDLDLGVEKTTAGGRRRISDYTELIVVREHGEIGPVLTWRDQRFTGAADL